MSDTSSRLDRRLRPILDLLHKHELVDGLVRQQEAPRKQLVEDLVHRMPATTARRRRSPRAW